MSSNREYKNSVFAFLFSNPHTLRELYGALTGVTIDPSVPIVINTLEGVLFKERMNDVSFEMDRKQVIVLEHQSSINENMPLRILLYISRIYEAIITTRSIYREKRIALPYPEFIVLYNGTIPCPDEYTLKLSDAFSDPGELRLSKGIPLELTVKVYNINQGHNEKLLKKSETLGGYSAFIATVRGYEQGGKSRDEAMKLAVKDCIGKGILREFLKRHGAEVVNMLLTEWNWDDALAVREEEGVEQGREEAAKNLFDFGMSPEWIAEALRLPLNTVQQYLE
jgi:hypothetical protein